MQEFLTFAHRLADASGAIVRHYFRTPLTPEHKADASPVTLADREAEAALRGMIEQAYPQHGFVGEESGKLREDAEYVWVIDPIDGTKNFMIGKPIFGTLIALIHRGVPILGIIDCPLTNERWSGSGNAGSFINNQLISVDKIIKPLNECILSTTSPYLFAGEKKTAFERLRENVRHVTVMALIPVIEGAGGIITDWQGQPIRFGAEETDVLAAANAEIHAQAHRLLQYS